MIVSQPCDPCWAARSVSRYLADWYLKQGATGEDSLSDWFLYQLSELIPNLTYRRFNQWEEGTQTGADWQWWIVSGSRGIGLRIQAKKLSDKDLYPALARSNRHGLQIEMLRKDATSQKMTPLYAFLSPPKSSASSQCRSRKLSGAGGVWLAPADEVYQRHIIPGRKKVSSNDLIQISRPLHCLFCCSCTQSSPAATLEDYADFVASLMSTVDLTDREAQAPRRPEIQGLPEAVLAVIQEQEDGVTDSGRARDFGELFPGTGALIILDISEEAQ